MCKSFTAVLLKKGHGYKVLSNRRDLDRVLSRLKSTEDPGKVRAVLDQALSLPCITDANTLSLSGIRSKHLVFKDEVRS